MSLSSIAIFNRFQRPLRSRDMDSVRTRHTAFLVSNLHCPSCVQSIERALDTLHPRPISLSHDIVNHTITVKHPARLAIRTIMKTLEDSMSALSVRFDFDQEILRSQVYRNAIKSSWRSAAQGSKYKTAQTTENEGQRTADSEKLKLNSTKSNFPKAIVLAALGSSGQALPNSAPITIKRHSSAKPVSLHSPHGCGFSAVCGV